MDIVDAQVHFNLLGSLEAGVAAMDAVGVNGVLYDEYWGFDEQSRILPGYELPGGAFRHLFPLAQAAALSFPDRFAYLARVDRRDPELERLIEELQGTPHCKALRVVPWTEQGFAEFAAGADAPIFAAAQRQQLAVFVLLPGRTPLLRPYLQQFPEVQVIIDHCGVRLPVPGVPPADWAADFEDLLSLAEFPNVAVKWSHAPRLSRQAYPYPDVLALLTRVVERFTPQRVMWGSDCTQSRDHHSWAESLYCIRDTTELGSDEKRWILGGSLRELLHWPAPVRPVDDSA